MKKTKLIIAMCCMVAVMVTGYAYFLTSLTVVSTGSISTAWKVRFTDVTEGDPNGTSATNASAPSFTDTTATMSVDLLRPGDEMNYELTLSNSGDVDAIIEQVNVSESGTSAIVFEIEGISNGDKLIAGQVVKVKVRIYFDPTAPIDLNNTNKTLTISIKTVQDVGGTSGEVTAIKINKAWTSLSIDESVSLAVNTIPGNATPQIITWESSNIGVAEVDQYGMVTAKSAGSAIITARTANGLIATSTVSVKHKPATLTEMQNSYTKVVEKAGDRYYAYAPSVMIKDNATYIWSCQNRYSSMTYDHIYLNTSTSTSRTLVLSPSSSGWDSYHICDPSVVEGNFIYNNTTYKYAMAYLGIDNGGGKGNDIGLAVSNSLDSGWVKVNNSAYISYNNTDRWGVGQPSLIYADGKLIMFYTNDIGESDGMKVVIINPNTMTIEATSGLSTKNTTWMHNADFAFKDNRLYVSYEGPEQLTTGDIISNTIHIKSVFINNFADINAYKDLSWEDENIITSEVSGQVRNSNAGLYRLPNGELYSREVAFTSTTQGINNGHYTYNIFKSKF